MLNLLLLLMGYLVGSISSAIVVSACLRLPDPRVSGSKNPGATNVLRLGSKTGALVSLLGDTAKSFGPIVLIQIWIPNNSLMVATIALGAFLGHLFPLYFKFKGGKGVATAFGIFLAVYPFVALLQVVTWAIAAMAFRHSSLAALVATATTPLYLLLYDGDSTFLLLSKIIGILVFWRHSKNIKRLIEGTEPKIGADR